MTRVIALVVGVLILAGCAAGVPATVVWTTVGAGLGFGTAALTFDTTALEIWNQRNPPQPEKQP